MSDLHELLGVDVNASPQQIQSAYLYWAHELHEEDPAFGLEQLQRAYSVLARPGGGHPQTGRAAAEPLRPPERAQPAPAAGTPPIEFSLRESLAAFQPSFDELFERLWSNFGPVTRPKAERLEALTVEIPVSPEEAVLGGAARILIPARAECPSCAGHGAIGPYACWRCEGHGAITADYPVEITFPPLLQGEYTAQLPLDRAGIQNFYLTVRFRISERVAG